MMQSIFLRIFVLLPLVLAVAATGDDSESEPSFLRALGAPRCSSYSCPVTEPLPGGRCCYRGGDACDYDHVYVWSADCQTIQCQPITMCYCTQSYGRWRWQCAMARRNLSAMAPEDCESKITPATRQSVVDLVPLVGTTCIA